MDFYKLLSNLGILVSAAGIFGFCWQCYVYFKWGSWMELPLIIVPQILGWGWIDNPKSWFGAHKIIVSVLNAVSVPVFLLIAGWAINWSADEKVSNLEQIARRKESLEKIEKKKAELQN